jgi:glycosyltransferase involved in cell wall biosynthesis
MKVLQIHNHDSFNLEFAKIPGIEIFNLVNEKNGHKVWGGGSRPKPDNVHALEYENINDIDCSQYDLFLVHSLERYEAVKGLPIKKVYLEHTLPYPLYNGAPHNEIIKDPYVKKVVFLSEEQVLSWKIKDIFQVEVIPSCINVDEYEEWKGGENAILTAVNELPRRNWCCGMDVWEKCSMGLPRVLLGDGNEDVKPNKLYPQYEQYEVYNLNAAGFKKQNEARPYFINSAVYFNTNLYSTLPFALMEAMAHGMPIVSTNKNTAALYLENETTQHKKKSAFLSNIPFELRYYLRDILNNPGKDEWREIGLAARASAREFFDPNRFISQWEGVLQEV